ncbi:MAG TPA: phosphatidylglycerol lysyltransferase domain-containing protein, partial [Methanocorpusculum sp.]|nr:phosphatidylglycerol lysyltransferase domain-containing protein [Methanocorpusculum sp.]
IGLYNETLFEEVLEVSKTNNGANIIEIYDYWYIEYLKKAHPETPIYTNNESKDYYYRSRDLAELPGKKYQKIRNQINKFNSKYEYKTEKITNSLISEIKKMVVEWVHSKNMHNISIMNDEVDALYYVLNHWTECECDGIAIRITDENRIAAISIWEILNESTVLVHFEKGLVEYSGIYKIINQETAKSVCNNYTWINRECDMGVPGLREAKRRYHPDHYVNVWYIKN